MPQDADFKNSLKVQPVNQYVNNYMNSLLDEYQTNNSFENREFLCYLASAIFLTYRKYYPQISAYIPFRTKGDISYISNIVKEFNNFMTDLTPEQDFNRESITKDISGFRLVIDHINHSRKSTEKSKELFNDSEIKDLMSNLKENLEFIDIVDDYLNSSIHSGSQYYELNKEILKKIISITPEEFISERDPHSSYKSLYKKTIRDYNYYANSDTFPTIIGDYEIDKLTDLLNDFRLRIYDQLQFAILRKTLPVVLNDRLIKDALQTTFTFEKELKKSNGFQSIYYTLHTPFGSVELQAQSSKAYYTATKGSAYHSGLSGKSINVRDFFELKDPNDEHDLMYYLNILDSVSADAMISVYELPKFETEAEKKYFFNTPEGKAYLDSEKYREMISHIRIKDTVGLLPQSLPKEAYNDDKTINKKRLDKLIDEGKVKLYYIDTNKHLLSLSLSISPYMNVCSSGHTSFGTVEIHHKKILGEITESFRKRDSITLLRELIIQRIKSIIEDPEKYHINSSEIKVIKTHDDYAARLPKDISKQNIIDYAQNTLSTRKNNNDQQQL